MLPSDYAPPKIAARSANSWPCKEEAVDRPSFRMELPVVAATSTNDPTRGRRGALGRCSEGMMLAAGLAFAAEAAFAKLKRFSRYQHSRARPIQTAQ